MADISNMCVNKCVSFIYIIDEATFCHERIKQREFTQKRSMY